MEVTKEIVENWWNELYDKEYEKYWVYREGYNSWRLNRKLRHTDDLFFKYKARKLISALRHIIKLKVVINK
jgi:hypothetical protein